MSANDTLKVVIDGQRVAVSAEALDKYNQSGDISEFKCTDCHTGTKAEAKKSRQLSAAVAMPYHGWI